MKIPAFSSSHPFLFHLYSFLFFLFSFLGGKPQGKCLDRRGRKGDPLGARDELPTSGFSLRRQRDDRGERTEIGSGKIKWEREREREVEARRDGTER